MSIVMVGGTGGIVYDGYATYSNLGATVLAIIPHTSSNSLNHTIISSSRIKSM
jgi:hypothetical protein